MGNYDWVVEKLKQGGNPMFVMVKGERGKWFLTFAGMRCQYLGGGDDWMEVRGSPWTTDEGSYGTEQNETVPTYHEAAHVYELTKGNYGKVWKECPSEAEVMKSHTKIG